MKLKQPGVKLMTLQAQVLHLNYHIPPPCQLISHGIPSDRHLFNSLFSGTTCISWHQKR